MYYTNLQQPSEDYSEARTSVTTETKYKSKAQPTKEKKRHNKENKWGGNSKMKTSVKPEQL